MPRPARADTARAQYKAAVYQLDATQPALTRALTNLQLWAGRGYPTGTELTRTSNQTSSVEQAATTHDPHATYATHQLTQLLGLIGTLHQVTDEIARRITAATTTATHPGAEGCQHCALIDHPDNWQPIYTQHRCSFHSEFLERYSVDAHRQIGLWHLEHRGSRIPYDLIRQHHPLEYATHHTRTRARAR